MVTRPKQIKKVTPSNDKGREKKTNPYNPQHPMNNQKNHQLLMQHIKDRLDFGNEGRMQLCDRFAYIDRELAGYLELGTDDRKRDRDNKRGKGLKAVDTKLLLAATQLEEELTYFMSVFAPDSGMFTALARKGEQQVANAFVQRLNQDGDRFHYYDNYRLGFYDQLKYNIGGWLVEWQKVYGNKLDTDASGTNLQMKADVVYQGNSIEAVDVYNLIWDRSVNPSELNRKGEFFALVDVIRKFQIDRMEEQEEIFDCYRFDKSGEINPVYYYARPKIRGNHEYGQGDGGTQANTSGTDWFNYVSAGRTSEATKGYELVTYYGWLKPKKFGLSNDDKYQIWRIIVVNNQYIVRTDEVTSAHGMLPISLGCPRADNMQLEQKSYGEVLIPLQTFASAQVNVHQRSNRKALYGMTFYDPTVVPLKDKSDEDLESGKIPVNMPAQDKDIRKYVMQINDTPKTENTTGDIDRVWAIMQKMLPTDIAKQVADLERATKYQAAATVQGTSRRSLHIARISEDQSMKPVRFMVMYNFYQNEPQFEVKDDQGQPTTVTRKQLIDAGIEFTLSEGLKGIDKLMIIETYKELFGYMIQIPGLMQQYDLVGWLNYLSTLMGDKTDLGQFRIQNPLMTLPPDVQQKLVMALQSGQLDSLLQNKPAQPGGQAPIPAGAMALQPPVR